MLDNSGKQKLIMFFKENVKSGAFEVGSKVRSTQELAKEFCIAIPTAHAALKQLESEGIITRKRGKGTFICATVNQNQNYKTAILIEKDSQTFKELISTLLIQLKSIGINCEIVEYETLESFNKSLLTKNNYNCVIVPGLHPALFVAKALPELNIISLSEIYCPEFSGFSFSPNHYATAFEGVKYLAKLGHSKIACFYVGGHDPERMKKVNGWQPVLNGYNDSITQVGSYQKSYAIGSGKSAITMLKKELSQSDRPTAIFCQHDYRAMEVIEVAAELGLNIPKDLALVSAGNSPIAETNQLTSFDLNMDSLVDHCKQLINGLASGKVSHEVKTQTLIYPKIIIRESCGGSLKNKGSQHKKDWHKMIEQEV